MSIDFDALRPRIAELCRRYGIAELSVFGSVARGEDRSDSDVDLLYVRAAESVMGLAFFGMQEELEELLGRKVDLVPKDYLHWIIKDRVIAEREPSMRREELYLGEIVEAADRIAVWLDEVSTDQWAHDELLRSAVLLKLITIGEAARALSEQMRTRHPDVPWPRLVAFRNVAVHEYFAIEWPTVWTIVQDELPELRKAVFLVLQVEYPEIARQLEGRAGDATDE